MGGLDEWLPPASAGHRNRLTDRAGSSLFRQPLSKSAALGNKSRHVLLQEKRVRQAAQPTRWGRVVETINHPCGLPVDEFEDVIVIKTGEGAANLGIPKMRGRVECRDATSERLAHAKMHSLPGDLLAHSYESVRESANSALTRFSGGPRMEIDVLRRVKTDLDRRSDDDAYFNDGHGDSRLRAPQKEPVTLIK